MESFFFYNSFSSSIDRTMISKQTYFFLHVLLEVSAVLFSSFFNTKKMLYLGLNTKEKHHTNSYR